MKLILAILIVGMGFSAYGEDDILQIYEKAKSEAQAEKVKEDAAKEAREQQDEAQWRLASRTGAMEQAMDYVHQAMQSMDELIYDVKVEESEWRAGNTKAYVQDMNNETWYERLIQVTFMAGNKSCRISVAAADSHLRYCDSSEVCNENTYVALAEEGYDYDFQLGASYTPVRIAGDIHQDPKVEYNEAYAPECFPVK